MNTYENIKMVIAGRKKTQEELLNMSDIFLMNSRINDEQYRELLTLINEKYE
jgi:CHAD domain-containing protein